MRYLLFPLLFLALGLNAWGQMTASKAFIDAPQQIFPLLDKSTRMDMVDYKAGGMDTPSANALSGKSVITSMTPKLLNIRTSDSSTAQVAVLQGDRGEVVAVVTTLATPGLDSNVSFYDSSWKPMNGVFQRPGMKDWATGDGAAHLGEIEAQVPFMLASYDIDPEKGILTVTNNLEAFLDPAIYEMLKGWLQPTLSYTWTGKSFKANK